MAITKLHPIKYSTLAAVAYITNPGKTDGQLLVSSFRCDPPTAENDFARVASLGYGRGDIKAQHLIQSFAPGEVDEKTAHEIGIKLAERFTEGKHQYIIATHIDKEHIHNHIIFNQVDFMEHKKFRGNKVSVRIMQKINDDLCRSYGLSVIEEKQCKGCSYYEWQKVRESKSAKEILKRNIDLCISLSSDFDTFLFHMKRLGYEIKNTGTYYSFRLSGQQRFKRLKTLGDDYSEEGIKKRLELRRIGTAAVRNSNSYHKSNRLSGIEHNYSDKSTAYKNKVGISDTKKLAATYNFLSSKGLLSYHDLKDYVTTLQNTQKEITSSLKEIENKISNLSQAKDCLLQMEKHHEIYKQYTQNHQNPDFFIKHRSSILLYEGALKSLGQLENTAGLSKEQIAVEIEQLLFRQTTLTNELTLKNAALHEVSDHYQNATYILKKDVHEDARLQSNKPYHLHSKQRE